MATRASQLYRKLLKIQKITFQNDIRMITGYFIDFFFFFKRMKG